MMTSFVFAEARQEGQSQDTAARQRPQRTAPAGRMDAAGREQMLKQRMVQQAEAHRAKIQELLDIKKIAEEENATKTADAIQKLIDKKNAEYQKNVDQVEQIRQERAARLQRRGEQAETQKQDAQPDTKTPDKTEDQ
jgi:hypothetical protein